MGRVHPRTRTGCLPCRQRKKKCDEAKPQCRACTRNKLQCAWPPHIVRIFGLDTEKVENHNELYSCEESGSPIETQSNSLLPVLPAASTGPGTKPEGTEQVTSRRGRSLLSCNLEWNWFSTIPVSTLVSESPMLLSHYLEDTAPKLSPALNIPWVTWIMPVAYNDDLLMNAILALSGGHLLYKLPDSQDIRHATHHHYSSAVRSLRYIFNDESMLSKPLTLRRVTLAILILFHYEVVSGHVDGSPFMHLRATRQLVSNLQNVSSQISSVAERRLYGFVREVYSYIVSCNSITPFNMDGNRTLVHDSSLQGFNDLENLGAFGVMFSGGHEIFELISSVSILATKEPNLYRQEEYRQLKARISTWEFPSKEFDADLRPGRSQALEVCRLALLAFLETTKSPFSKYDIDRIQQLQPLLDVAVLELTQLLPSKYSCIMMWPIIVIGSCLVKKDQRELVSHMLLHNQYGMKNTGQAQMLLELLWSDSDEYAYGPYGLGLLMNRHKLHYGVI